MTIVLEKRDLRRRLRKMLRAIAVVDRQKAGFAVANHISSWLTKSPTLTVAYFVNLDDEISTEPLDELLIKYDIKRALPCIGHNDELVFHPVKAGLVADLDISNLYDHHHGQTALTIIPLPAIDIIFVPGLAFDTFGRRLGRGKGYYDRALSPLLSLHSEKPLLVGLAMDEQIVAQVMCEPHDVLMDYLCTPALGMHPIAP